MITPDGVERRGSAFPRANELVSRVVGESLDQFRMGYRIHLELGDDHLVTIETPLAVTSPGAYWVGEPTTGEAAGALLRLVGERISSARILSDGTLQLFFGAAAIEVRPHAYYEAWQLHGVRGLSVVCAPGGEYVAVFGPDPQR